MSAYSGTPGFTERDFVGVSHSSLVGMLQSACVTDRAFRQAIIDVVNQYGASHNQRSLLEGAFTRAVDASESTSELEQLGQNIASTF